MLLKTNRGGWLIRSAAGNWKRSESNLELGSLMMCGAECSDLLHPQTLWSEGPRSVLWASFIYSSILAFWWYSWFIKFGCTLKKKEKKKSLWGDSVPSAVFRSSKCLQFTNKWSANLWKTNRKFKVSKCGWRCVRKRSGFCILSVF